MADFKYTHYCGYKKIDPEWNKDLKTILVRNYKELKYLLFDKYKDAKFAAFDTETTGLDPQANDADLVGFSFSYDGKNGYYVPVNHSGYKYLDENDTEYSEDEYFNLGAKAFEMFYQKMQTHTKTFLANMMFDYNYLEYVGAKYGYDWNMGKCPYYDIFVGLFLADTNVPFPNLKKSEAQYLGWNRENFEATLGDYTNFAYVPIEMSYQYAGYDALGTYNLAPISLKFYKEAGLSGKLDNEFLYVLTQFLKRGVRCDVALAKKTLKEQEERLLELQNEIWDIFGYQFNIGSGAQLSQALTSIGFDTGERTKSGAMKTGMYELTKANEKRDEPHPIVDLIIEYKTLAKSISSFAGKMVEEGERFTDNEIRYNYTTFRVPCLTEDARVHILNKGLVSIKDVNIGDYIWTQYGWKKVLWNNKKWSDTTYELELTNGLKLRGTGHHPVLVNKKKQKVFDPEWAGISCVKKDEWVLLNHDCPDPYLTDYSLPNKIEGNLSGGWYKVDNNLDYTLPNIDDYRFYQILGFIDGDGSLRTDRVKFTYNKEQPFMHKYSEYFSDIHSLKCYEYEERTVNTHCFFSTSLVRWYKNLGSRGNGVPSIVLQAGPKAWVHYIAGLWDTDGSLCYCGDKEAQLHPDKCHYNPRIKIIKENTMRDVSLMLHLLGIPNTFSRIPYKTQDQYQVRITSDQGRAMFKALIGSAMINEKHLERMKDLPDDYISWSHARCKSVTRLEGDWVYDIEVEDVHEFIANGIVTHNTGRLASSGDAKNKYFATINVQALPKPHSKMWYVHKVDPSNPTYKHSESDSIILDWRFSLTDKSEYMTEALDPHYSIRNMSLPDEGHYWVSMDYSAQELRAIANFSNIPFWKDTFINGGDLHERTAKMIWGEENYNHDLRKRAKGANSPR